MNPDEASKQFCDNVNIRFNEEYFLFQVHSGMSNVVYALTPAHFKRLALAAQHNLTEYEKANGAIKTEWPVKVPSPIQQKDLNAKQSGAEE